jgi:hypothetical protein
MSILDKIFQRLARPESQASRPGPPTGPRPWFVERLELIRVDRAAGMKTTEIAEKYNLSITYVRSLTRGMPLPPQKYEMRAQRSQDIIERNLAMVAAYEKGEENLQSLGDKYGITRERVRQILEPVGSTALIKEQRRIRREEVRATAAELRAAVRAERAQKIAQAVEIVRQGFSINEARRRVPGLPVNGLQLECRKAGVESGHGRWRDLTPKINRARELRATGMSWTKISKQLAIEGFGNFAPGFVTRHMPDLVLRHTRQTNGAGVVDQMPLSQPLPKERVSKPKKVWVDPESIWTDDTVARLKTLWFNGNTAQQCSDVLGTPFTRNAILGKINRLRGAGQLRP